MNIKQLETDLKFKKFVVRVLFLIFLKIFMGDNYVNPNIDDIRQMHNDLRDDFENYKL